jgi:hypothetical protein
MSAQFGLNVVPALNFVALSIGLAPQGNRPPDIDERVDVGGYSLHITCAGRGSPTVILEAGLGANGRTWQKVMPDISKIGLLVLESNETNAAPRLSWALGRMLSDPKQQFTIKL